jgi:hypothetical protein
MLPETRLERASGSLHYGRVRTGPESGGSEVRGEEGRSGVRQMEERPREAKVRAAMGGLAQERLEMRPDGLVRIILN